MQCDSVADDPTNVSKVGRLTTEHAEVHGRATMPHEINRTANRNYERRQKYPRPQQVPKNIFDSLIGPASVRKH
jgi:hypothetical protein